MYSPESTVRKTGSYIYEEFMPTDGTDVKVNMYFMPRHYCLWWPGSLFILDGCCRFTQSDLITLTPKPVSLLLWMGKWRETVRGRRSAIL